MAVPRRIRDARPAPDPLEPGGNFEGGLIRDEHVDGLNVTIDWDGVVGNTQGLNPDHYGEAVKAVYDANNIQFTEGDLDAVWAASDPALHSGENVAMGVPAERAWVGAELGRLRLFPLIAGRLTASAERSRMVVERSVELSHARDDARRQSPAARDAFDTEQRIRRTELEFLERNSFDDPGTARETARELRGLERRPPKSSHAREALDDDRASRQTIAAEDAELRDGTAAGFDETRPLTDDELLELDVIRTAQRLDAFKADITGQIWSAVNGVQRAVGLIPHSVEFLAWAQHMNIPIDVVTAGLHKHVVDVAAGRALDSMVGHRADLKNIYSVGQGPSKPDPTGYLLAIAARLLKRAGIQGFLLAEDSPSAAPSASAARDITIAARQIAAGDVTAIETLRFPAEQILAGAERMNPDVLGTCDREQVLEGIQSALVSALGVPNPLTERFADRNVELARRIAQPACDAIRSAGGQLVRAHVFAIGVNPRERKRQDLKQCGMDIIVATLDPSELRAAIEEQRSDTTSVLDAFTPELAAMLTAQLSAQASKSLLVPALTG